MGKKVIIIRRDRKSSSEGEMDHLEPATLAIFIGRVCWLSLFERKEETLWETGKQW